MEQFVLLIIIGLISLINWIIQKSAQKRNRQQGGELPDPEPNLDFDWEETTELPPPQVQQRAPLSEDERARQFMEALGLPATAQSPTPPPVPRQQAPAPAPRKQAAASVSRDAQPRAATPMPDSPWQGREVIAPQLSKAEAEALARLEAQGGSGAYNIRSRADRDAASSSGNIRVLDLLRNSEGLKAAILAREVLGTPPGLQPLPGPEVVRL